MGSGTTLILARLIYELAEFDFTELTKNVRLDRFHFSQFHSLFQIGWREIGYNLELRVHIEPLVGGVSS